MNFQVEIPNLETQNHLLSLLKKKRWCVYNHRDTYYKYMTVNEECKNIGGNHVADNRPTKSLSDLMLLIFSPKEKPITIGNYEVKFLKGRIQVGCKTFKNSNIKNLLQAMQLDTRAESGEDMCYSDDIAYLETEPDLTISLEELKKIIKKLK